jgi:MoxR-like ATPase
MTGSKEKLVAIITQMEQLLASQPTQSPPPSANEEVYPSRSHLVPSKDDESVFENLSLFDELQVAQERGVPLTFDDVPETLDVYDFAAKVEDPDGALNFDLGASSPTSTPSDDFPDMDLSLLDLSEGIEEGTIQPEVVDDVTFGLSENFEGLNFDDLNFGDFSSEIPSSNDGKDKQTVPLSGHQEFLDFGLGSADLEQVTFDLGSADLSPEQVTFDLDQPIDFPDLSNLLEPESVFASGSLQGIPANLQSNSEGVDFSAMGVEGLDGLSGFDPQMMVDLDMLEDAPLGIIPEVPNFAEWISAQLRGEGIPLLSAEEKELIEELDALIQSIVGVAGVLDVISKDASGVQIIKKIESIWSSLKNSRDRSQPIFLFRDGPVTKAAKSGGVLFLEDFDLPTQGVTERLNSLLEPTPTFTLTEDVTLDSLVGGAGSELQIALPPSFQVFATVHQESDNQTLNLSPATRSRFTEIRVVPYDDAELVKLVKGVCKSKLSTEVDHTTIREGIQLLFDLRKHVIAADQWTTKYDIQQLLRATDFICEHPSLVEFKRRIFLGMRFFYFDEFVPGVQKSLFENFKKAHPMMEDLFDTPTVAHGAWDLSLNNPAKEKSPHPIRLVVHNQDCHLQLLYTGVACVVKEGFNASQLEDNFYLARTPTLLTQFARVFASIQTGCPLLLEGPPGIGKTAIVAQIAQLLGVKCERLNFSNNTTPDQLFGAIIPRVVHGQRVFNWQAGRLTQALIDKKWVLFDEINLAPPEVLDALAPLLARNATEFLVPGTDKKIDVSGIHVFGTMNPASIGGGRCKLPRSIKNLFAVVKLEEYNAQELRIILSAKIFRDLIGDDDVTDEHVTALFNLQQEVKLQVNEHKIGRGGGPFEFNLRNFSTFRDILARNARDQRFHYKHYQSKDVANMDIRLLSLRKFADLVYKSPFQTKEDREVVKKLIDKYFPISVELREQEMMHTIDTSVSESVRIGSIYMPCGLVTTSDSIPLVHTPETVKQLEMLAAATKSKKTVLLEGDTCSRKTASVVELARLTRNKLIIIPMNQDIETSDLIGQWMPVKGKGMTGLGALDRIEPTLQTIIKHTILYVIPLLSDKQKQQCLVLVKDLYKKKLDLEDDGAEKIVKAREMLDRIRSLLTNIVTRFPNLFPEVISLFEGHSIKIRYLKEKVDSYEQQTSAKSETSFEFVESELVQAIREGYWILLDNVNSAPPEVIERLNSLMEDDPILSLYEYSEGEVLTRENGKIHPNFRLFTTANLKRAYSNKLSSAFLNRVIHIWLPQLDAELDPQKVEESDLLKVLLPSFGTFGSKELASLCLKFHAWVKVMVDKGEIMLMADFALSYRNLAQTIQTFLYNVQNSNCSYVTALVWALLRTYTSSLINVLDCQKLVKKLHELLLQYKSLPPYLLLTPMTGNLTSLRQAELKLGSKMCDLEERLTQALAEMIVLPELRKTAIEVAPQFVALILLPMFSQHEKELTSLYEQFNKVVLTGSEEQFEEGLFQMKSLATHIPCIALSKDFKQSLPSIQDSCTKVSKEIVKFVKGATFEDSPARLEFVKRVFNILAPFESLLAALESPELVGEHILYKLTQLVESMMSRKTVQAWFAPLHSPVLAGLKQKFYKSIETSNERGASWAFQREQKRPILQSMGSIGLLIDSIAKQGVDFSHLDILRQYHLSLQWLTLLWEFYTSRKPASLSFSTQREVPFLKVLELEVMSATSALKTDIRKILEDASDQLTDFIKFQSELETQRKAVELGIGLDVQEREKLEKMECEQRGKDGELMNFLGQIRRKFDTVCRSQDAQLALQAADVATHENQSKVIQQLSELYGFPEIVQEDGALSVQKALFSRFGYFLRGIHNSVLASPLHLLWCGLFFVAFDSPAAPKVRRSLAVHLAHSTQPKLPLSTNKKHLYELVIVTTPTGSLYLMFIDKTQEIVSITVIQKQGEDAKLPASWLRSWKQHNLTILPVPDLCLAVTSDPIITNIVQLLGALSHFPFHDSQADLNMRRIDFGHVLGVVVQVSDLIKKELGWVPRHSIRDGNLSEELREVDATISSLYQWRYHKAEVKQTIVGLSSKFGSASIATIDQKLKREIKRLGLAVLPLHAKIKILSTLESWKELDLKVVHDLEREIKWSLGTSADSVKTGIYLVKDLEKLLKVLSRFVMLSVQFSNEKYREISWEAYKFCYELVATIFSAVHFEDDNIEVDSKIPADFFLVNQERLSQLLDGLQVPDQIRTKYKLDTFLKSYAALLKPTSSSASSAVEDDDMEEATRRHLEAKKERKKRAVQELYSLLKDASQVQPRPHNIIQKIRQMIVRLEDLDASKLDDFQLSIQLHGPKDLVRLLAEYKSKLNASLAHRLKVKMPQFNLRISVEQWQSQSHQPTAHNAEPVLRLLQRIKPTGAYEVGDLFTGSTIKTSIQTNCWKEAIELCHTANETTDKATFERFKALASILSDELALKCERSKGFNEQIKKSLLGAYAKYRSGLILDSETIADYSELRSRFAISTSMSQQTTLFNLAEEADSMERRAQSILNELKSYPRNIGCALLPVRLEFSDCLLLFHPEQVPILENEILKKLDKEPTEEEASIPRVEDIAQDLGLRSYKINNDRIFKTDVISDLQSLLQNLLSHIRSSMQDISEYSSLSSIYDAPTVQICLALILMSISSKLWRGIFNDVTLNNTAELAIWPNSTDKQRLLEDIKLLTEKIPKLEESIFSLQEARNLFFQDLTQLAPESPTRFGVMEQIRQTEAETDKLKERLEDAHKQLIKNQEALPIAEQREAFLQARERGREWDRFQEATQKIFDQFFDEIVSKLPSPSSGYLDRETKINSIMASIHSMDGLSAIEKEYAIDPQKMSLLEKEVATVRQKFKHDDKVTSAVMWLVKIFKTGVTTITNTAKGISLFIRSLKIDLKRIRETSEELAQEKFKPSSEQLVTFVTEGHTDLDSFRHICGELLSLHQSESLFYGSDALVETQEIFRYIDTLALVSCKYVTQQQALPEDSFLEDLKPIKHCEVDFEGENVGELLEDILLQAPSYFASFSNIFTHFCYGYYTNPFILVANLKTVQSKVLKTFLPASIAFVTLVKAVEVFFTLMLLKSDWDRGVSKKEAEALERVLESLVEISDIPITPNAFVLALKNGVVARTAEAVWQFNATLIERRPKMVEPCMQLSGALGRLAQEFLAVGISVQKDKFDKRLEREIQESLMLVINFDVENPDLEKLYLLDAHSQNTLLNKIRQPSPPEKFMDWFDLPHVVLSALLGNVQSAFSIFPRLCFFVENMNMEEWLNLAEVYSNKVIEIAKTVTFATLPKDPLKILHDLYQMDERIFDHLYVAFLKQAQAQMKSCDCVERSKTLTLHTLEKDWDAHAESLIQARAHARTTWIEQTFHQLKSIWTSWISKKKTYEEKLAEYQAGKKDLNACFELCAQSCWVLGSELLKLKPMAYPHSCINSLQQVRVVDDGINKTAIVNKFFEERRLHFIEFGDWELNKDDHKEHGLSKVIAAASFRDGKVFEKVLEHRYKSSKQYSREPILWLLPSWELTDIRFMFYSRKNELIPDWSIKVEQMNWQYTSRVYFGKGSGYDPSRSKFVVSHETKLWWMPKEAAASPSTKDVEELTAEVQRNLRAVRNHPYATEYKPRPLASENPENPDAWKSSELSKGAADFKSWESSRLNIFMQSALKTTNQFNHILQKWHRQAMTICNAESLESYSITLTLSKNLELNLFEHVIKELESLHRERLPIFRKVGYKSAHYSKPISDYWTDGLEQDVIQIREIIKGCMQIFEDLKCTVSKINKFFVACLATSLDTEANSQILRQKFLELKLPVDHLLYEPVSAIINWKLEKCKQHAYVSQIFTKLGRCVLDQSSKFNPHRLLQMVELRNMTDLTVSKNLEVISETDLWFGTVLPNEVRAHHVLYIQNHSDRTLSACIEWNSAEGSGVQAFLKPDGIIQILPQQKKALTFAFWTKLKNFGEYTAVAVLKLDASENDQLKVKLNLSASLVQPMIELVPDRLDLQNISKVPISKDVTLRNPLPLPLLVKPQVQSTSQSAASISLEHSVTLLPYQEKTIQVKITPHQTGIIEQMIYFGVNSADFIQQLSVTGKISQTDFTLTCPARSLVPYSTNDTLSLPDTSPKKWSMSELELFNKGNAELVWKVTSMEGQFLLKPTLGTVPPLSSTIITVFFQSSREDTYMGSCCFDFDSSKFTLKFKARCGAPKFSLATASKSMLRQLVFDFNPNTSIQTLVNKPFDPLQQSFVVNNPGTSSLKVQFYRNNMWQFSPRSLEIQAGQSSPVSLTFQPQELLSSEYSIPIKTNCGPQFLAVKFNVQQPSVKIMPGYIMLLSDTVNKILITNSQQNHAKVTFDWATPGEDFKLVDGTFTIAPLVEYNLYSRTPMSLKVETQLPKKEITVVVQNEFVIQDNKVQRKKFKLFIQKAAGVAPPQKDLFGDFSFSHTSPKFPAILAAKFCCGKDLSGIPELQSITKPVKGFSAITKAGKLSANAYLFGLFETLCSQDTQEKISKVLPSLMQLLCNLIDSPVHRHYFISTLKGLSGTSNPLLLLEPILHNCRAMEYFKPLICLWQDIHTKQHVSCDTLLRTLLSKNRRLWELCHALLSTNSICRILGPLNILSPSKEVDALRTIITGSGLEVFSAACQLVQAAEHPLVKCIELAAIAENYKTKSQKVIELVFSTANKNQLKDFLTRHYSNYSQARWQELISQIITEQNIKPKLDHIKSLTGYRRYDIKPQLFNIQHQCDTQELNRLYNVLLDNSGTPADSVVIRKLQAFLKILQMMCGQTSTSELDKVTKKIACLEVICNYRSSSQQVFLSACTLLSLLAETDDQAINWNQLRSFTEALFQKDDPVSALKAASFSATLAGYSCANLNLVINGLVNWPTEEDQLTVTFAHRIVPNVPSSFAQHAKRLAKCRSKKNPNTLLEAVQLLHSLQVLPPEDSSLLKNIALLAHSLEIFQQTPEKLTLAHVSAIWQGYFVCRGDTTDKTIQYSCLCMMGLCGILHCPQLDINKLHSQYILLIGSLLKLYDLPQAPSIPPCASMKVPQVSAMLLRLEERVQPNQTMTTSVIKEHKTRSLQKRSKIDLADLRKTCLSELVHIFHNMTFMPSQLKVVQDVNLRTDLSCKALVFNLPLLLNTCMFPPDCILPSP